MEARLQHEIEHGRYLVRHGTGEIWYWETPAGRIRRERRVRMLTSHIKMREKVLELGCGTGYLTRALAQTGAAITAIDISPDLLKVARRDYPADNVTFEVQNAYALTYPGATFDSVVGSSVLHHLEIDQALAQINRVLRPGGTIRFTEPNMLNPQIAIQKNIPAVKRKLGDSPDETAFFRWPLRRRLQHAGFREIQITPFDFLHPKIPSGCVPIVKSIGSLLEKTPLVREIAGSLYIQAEK
jgi:2-polyprenyl-3-methyl-5-hydroxy-6-metoxy-1,4-benzoquinol methylase